MDVLTKLRNFGIKITIYCIALRKVRDKFNYFIFNLLLPIKFAESLTSIIETNIVIK